MTNYCSKSSHKTFSDVKLSSQCKKCGLWFQKIIDFSVCGRILHGLFVLRLLKKKCDPVCDYDFEEWAQIGVTVCVALFRTTDGFGNILGRILLNFDINMVYIKKSCQYFNRRTSSHASLLLSLFVCDLVSHGSFVLRFGSDGAHFILYLCT